MQIIRQNLHLKHEKITILFSLTWAQIKIYMHLKCVYKYVLVSSYFGYNKMFIMLWKKIMTKAMKYTYLVYKYKIFQNHLKLF